MTVFAICFFAWCCLSAAFVVLMICRGYLAQHETEQLYLDQELPATKHQVADDAVRRLKFLGKVCTIFGAATVVVAVATLGIRAGQIALAANLL